MPSSVNPLAAALLIAAAAVAVDVRAQSVEVVYNDAVAGEAELRRDLDRVPPSAAPSASVSLLDRVRATVEGYERLARQFPRSGYSDDALWHGAILSADAYWQFGDPADRLTALRLFDQLVARYPQSRYIQQVPGHTLRLAAAAAATPPASVLNAVRREKLAGALRVTLELEREASFRDERIESPARVLLELRNTRTVDALTNATLVFPDDVVRQIRVGRQVDGVTRIALELTGSPRYSIYSLYNPYRLVIDFERAPTAPTTDASAAPTGADSRAPARKASSAPTSAVPAPPRRDDSRAPTREAPTAPPAANSRGGFSLSRQLGLGIARIVIDPGHGGRDPGAQVKGVLSEAELVLDVAKRLEKLLLKQPGVEVVLTRSTDEFVPLETRTDIANRAEADLFLSIHANASSDAAARGFETYFLSFAPNAQAEAIAARENAASVRTMRSLPDIVKAIALNNKIDESRDFAALVQSSLAERLKKVDRNARSLGVKQAPFMVLIGATMPSVLAEISFLTNRREAALLKTPTYRQQIAEALLAGVMNYQRSLKSPTVASQ